MEVERWDSITNSEGYFRDNSSSGYDGEGIFRDPRINELALYEWIIY